MPGRANTTVLPSPRSSLPGGATLTPGPAHRSSSGQSQMGRSANITITPSVTITPTNAPPVQQSNKLKNSHVSPRFMLFFFTMNFSAIKYITLMQT